MVCLWSGKVSALTQTGKVEEIVIDDSQAQKVETDEEDILCMMLYITITSLHHLNSQWNITPTPNNTVGVQQKLKDGLERNFLSTLIQTHLLDVTKLSVSNCQEMELKFESDYIRRT